MTSTFLHIVSMTCAAAKAYKMANSDATVTRLCTMPAASGVFSVVNTSEVGPPGVLSTTTLPESAGSISGPGRKPGVSIKNRQTQPAQQ